MSIIFITDAHTHNILHLDTLGLCLSQKNGMAYLRVFNCSNCFYCLFQELEFGLITIESRTKSPTHLDISCQFLDNVFQGKANLFIALVHIIITEIDYQLQYLADL